MADIKVYGAPWCPDCKRSKKFLAEHRVPYEWIDVDQDREGLRFVEEVQRGDRTTGEELRWHPQAACVFIGLDPNTAFLRGTLELDRWSFVVTDARFQTSLPGVFSAGDVRQGSTKQLGSAVGEGIGARLMVREYLQEHHQLMAIAVND